MVMKFENLVKKIEKVEYYPRQVSFVSQAIAYDYVKRRANIFNDKTIRRVGDYGGYTVVKEYNYFRDERTIWFWIFNQMNGDVIIVSLKEGENAGVWDIILNLDKILKLARR